MNFLGGMIPGSIQGDEGGVIDTAEALDNPMLAQAVVDLVIHWKERLGRDRIEHWANLIIAGNLVDVKETLGVVFPPGGLHRFLMSEEGGGLGEEDREGAQTEIRHRVGEVFALAPIRQARQDFAQTAHQIVEAGSLHAPSRWPKSAHNGLRNTSLSGPCGASPGALRPRPVVRPTGIQPAAR